MKTIPTLLFCVVLFFPGIVNAQSKTNDIAVTELPASVSQVLNKYVEYLNIASLDECAEKFTELAGGGLVNEDGKTLRKDIKGFSLKKDHSDIKFYKQPVVVTRVNKTYSGGQGFGASAIKGQVYKIWIAKKDGVAGLPAPVSIMVPEGHPTITTPKVVNIGSF